MAPFMNQPVSLKCIRYWDDPVISVCTHSNKNPAAWDTICSNVIPYSASVRMRANSDAEILGCPFSRRHSLRLEPAIMGSRMGVSTFWSRVGVTRMGSRRIARTPPIGARRHVKSGDNDHGIAITLYLML